MMKKSVACLALFAAACSSNAPTADQQRIAALEGEKAQLEAQLKEARSNVAKLKAVLGRGGSSEDAAAELSGPVAPQPVDPTPQNVVGVPQSAGDGGARANQKGYIE